MTCGSYLIDALHARGFRMTPQRMAILHALRSVGGHLTPTEILLNASRIYPNLTKATLYRTLDFLTRNGFAAAVHLGDSRVAYELVQEQHHHVMCRRCGRSLLVPEGTLRKVCEILSEGTGYAVEADHRVWFGLCSACQSAERRSDEKLAG